GEPVAAPVPHQPPPHGGRASAPDADPVAIRACLSTELASVFDAEWEHTLEAAKHSKDLAGVRTLLAHWRLHAGQELQDPGSYFRTLAVATQIQATGSPRPRSISWDEMREQINIRLVDAGQTPLPPAQRH
ncbi:MAG: DUF6247 family protein, partial [Pseudonocardia sp.]|nr:DUF6247 family protein [Pseudonocardia sp.]